MPRPLDLMSLLGSRICHDLISPLGAIGNGVELLAMSGTAAGPEMSLISESVENANARIRFFRVAYGAASEGQTLGGGEVAEILAGLGRSARTTIQWQVEGPVPRRAAKLAFLCLQCLESALPWGGRITVDAAGGAWVIAAEAGKTRDIAHLWRLFSGAEPGGDLAAADIQFALAPLWAAEAGFSLRLTEAPEHLRIYFAEG